MKEKRRLRPDGRKVQALLMNNISFIGLILVVVLFEILSEGLLLGKRNLMNIFNNFFTIGMISMVYTFVLSIGELDLSVGAIVGFSAAMGAFASKISLWLILPVAVLSGIAIGLLNGFTIARLRVESFIGTLAMSFVVRGLTTWFLNGSVGVPIQMRYFDKDWIKVTVAVITMVILYFTFERCSFGKHCRAVGASKEAARQSGVKVESVRLLAFTLCGLLSGLVGFFTLIRACTASSNTGNALEFDVLLAVLFGGMPLTGGWTVRFRAAVIGSLAMAVLKSGMSLAGIDGLIQQVVQGAILVIAVALSFDRKNAAVIK